jgi:hypothetical protein
MIAYLECSRSPPLDRQCVEGGLPNFNRDEPRLWSQGRIRSHRSALLDSECLDPRMPPHRRPTPSFCGYSGPELTAEAVAAWCLAQRLAIGYIPPRELTIFLERANRGLREEVLDACLCDSLEQLHTITQTTLKTYKQRAARTTVCARCRPRFRPRETYPPIYFPRV